ncbi:olfactory receptor 140-like [Hippopotamus amphibius kiboko]|uniref:olfactory receptor 140-like n=1 Tax=Hippopotamus amphibius kiboko TaxID=575201 RepID=UPI002595397E|nr:olfactory receptor 140-like [Hippopotamus amphibius kiboko]
MDAMGRLGEDMRRHVAETQRSGKLIPIMDGLGDSNDKQSWRKRILEFLLALRSGESGIFLPIADGNSPAFTHHLIGFRCCRHHARHYDPSFTSALTPKLIIDLLYKRRTISWGGCLTQLFVEHFLGGSEVIILTVMSYDCYVAICKPLHYTTIMRQGICQLLVVVGWMGGILHATVQILFMLDLTFCGPNIIDHFMCELFSLLELACGDTYWLGMVVTANSGGMSFFILFMLLISYIVILSSLKSHSSEG